MKKELRIFFTAVSFYSRIPVPAYSHKDNAQYLPDAIRYLPVVGWLAGLLAASVYTAVNYFFGNTMGIIFSMVATVFMTGAFHEDGFADVCDGFGGGYSKDKILSIMKDSQLGTFGVLGLFFLMSLKFAALQQLSIIKFDNYLSIASIMVTTHSLSRLAAISVTYQLQYVRLDDSKVKAAVIHHRVRNLIIAVILTLIPLLALVIICKSTLILIIIVPVTAVTGYLVSYFKKRIGGYTGDCLGAVQQINELVIYLTLIAVWRYI